MKRVDNEFFGVSKADTSFNLQAATDAYYRVINMGDEAEFVVRSVIFDHMDADFTLIRKGAQRLVDDHVQRTVSLTQAALARKISKGADPHAYGAALVLTAISKAYGGDEFNRDVRGRFAHVEQRKFNYEKGTQKVKDSVINRMTPGSKDINTKGMDAETAAKMQQAYLGIHQMLQRARQYGIPESDVLLDLQHQDGTKTTQFGTDAGKAMKTALETGNPIVSADLHVDRGLTAGGAAFDVMKPLGAAGANAAQTVRQGSGEPISTFADEWNAVGNNPRTPNKQAYHRIGSAASLLESALPDGTPGKVRLAVAAGKWVGQHGDEAEKVMGPGARKAAYRYRGIERKPDADLLRSASAVLTGIDNPNERRKMLIYGDRNAVVGYGPKKPGASQGTPIVRDVESPVVEYFSNRLPDPSLLLLQTESGQVPPSEGVIIDRNGKITTQAVGYGDDHYLPFNLKNMSNLQGGEYVRTRAVGGLTTEDVYAGLVSGARAVTVVSNSGVYTMEFDPTFRGGRRFNDKAVRMVNRYGMLLDSVKSETITLQNIPPDRYAELKQAAISRYPDESEEGERASYFKKLEDKEKRDPQMSAQGRDAVALQVLEDYAAAHKTNDGGTPTWEQIKNQRVRQAQIKASNLNPDAPADVRMSWAEGAREKTQAELDAPQTAIQSLGLEERYTKSLARAEHEYRAAQKPLKLNSDGYFAAQRALKEQFPYYISHTDMRPKAMPGANDAHVGYVNPRFNRPSAARVGYFDANVDGQAGGSKISAQYTNYQNAANNPEPRESRAPSAPEERKEEPAREAMVVNPQIAKDKALLDLVEHINAQGAFSPDIAQEAFKGRDIHDPAAVHTLKTHFGGVWGRDRDAIERDMGDPVKRQKIQAEVRGLIKDRFFDLDQGKVAAFEGGKVQSEPYIKGDSKDFLTEYLYAGKSNITFPGGEAAYEGRLANPSNYEAKYQGLLQDDHHVQKLGLGKNLAEVSEGAIEAKKRELKNAYVADQIARQAYNDAPSYAKPAKPDQVAFAINVAKPAQALAKVEMLKRHYGAAVKNSPAASGPDVVNEYHLHAPGSPASEAFQAAWPEAGPTPKAQGQTIQGAVEGSKPAIQQGYSVEELFPGMMKQSDYSR